MLSYVYYTELFYNIHNYKNQKSFSIDVDSYNYEYY